MRVTLTVATVLMVAASASALAIHALLVAFGITLGIKQIPIILPSATFAGIAAWGMTAASDALKIISHVALTRRSADRVMIAIEQLRDRLFGVCMYLLLSLVISVALPSFASTPLIDLWLLSVTAGLSFVAVVCFPYVILKQRDVGNLQHRLEQKKRDDEARTKAIAHLSPKS